MVVLHQHFLRRLNRFSFLSSFLLFLLVNESLVLFFGFFELFFLSLLCLFPLFPLGFLPGLNFHHGGKDASGPSLLVQVDSGHRRKPVESGQGNSSRCGSEFR